MSSEASTPLNITPRIPPRPQGRRRRGRLWWLLGLLVAIPASLWAAGVRPNQIWKSDQTSRFETVPVDHGTVYSTVIESGSLESIDNAMIRCKVEAVLGMVGGTQNGQGGRSGGRNGSTSGGSSTSGGTSGGAAAKTTTTATTSTTGSTSTSKTGTTSTSGTNSTAQAAAKSTSGSLNATTSASSGGIIQKPTIQSFGYVVQPHTPLRGATQTTTTNQNQNRMANQGGQQQGNRGGGNQQEDRAGSTVILKILDEGVPVKEGQEVCWLDSSTFEEELRAQLIRYAQAKSWVEQAERALEVAQIEYDQYKNGIYPQDLELINQYIETCKLRINQTRQTLDWESEMAGRNLRSPTQVRAAEYGHQRAELALREADGMKVQLVKYSGPKILTNIEAKIASVKSDLQAQLASFKLEEQRKQRLERAIANCTLRSPRDGILVYANETNGWGRVETQIREGLAVRENQPIIMVPDPTRMRVRTKINESKVSLLASGTPALIQADAFPNRLLRGHVTEVTVIPTPVNGPFSDVKVYFAMVAIDENGFTGLRTGMSARVEFLVDQREDVVRVPVRAVRWFEGEAFVAVPKEEGQHAWRHVDLGLRNSSFAEVKAGLKSGEVVIVEPGDLAPPSRAERESAKAESWGDLAAASTSTAR